MNQASEARRLWLFATGTHECAYLPERTARTLFVDPHTPLHNDDYSQLIRRGMRRSGPYVYTPGCPACTACQSLRIPVHEFAPRRRQRRCWRHNTDLTARILPPQYREDHFALYRRYLQARHPGGGMDDHDPDSYMEFLVAPWSDTRFVEWRLGPELLAVAVIDRVADGLSAVYTFFDPEAKRRGLGTYAILWQIDAARRWGLDYLYLGYWIAECSSMRYKADFRPCEVYRDGDWQPLTQTPE